MEEIELHSINTRFEHTRQRDAAVERHLLASISSVGIYDPVQVVSNREGTFLLDGFKRYRCARRLGFTQIPAESIGDNPAAGICSLIRRCACTGLNNLEQASLVDVLHNEYGLTISQIARKLGRSNAWVCIRLGLLRDMSSVVREKIMAGSFPFRAYMYWLRKFTRVKARDVDDFVTAISGKGLSTRDIFVLIHAFFITQASLVRTQILAGNVEWTLRLLKEDFTNDCADGKQLTATEASLIEDLEGCRRYIDRILYVSSGKPLQGHTVSFTVRLNLLCRMLMQRERKFFKMIKDLYARSGQTAGSTDTVSAGSR